MRKMTIFLGFASAFMLCLIIARGNTIVRAASGETINTFNPPKGATIAALEGTFPQASGMPNSPYVGYGARLFINGLAVQPAIETSAHLGLDWLALDFDWAAAWAKPSDQADLSALDRTMALAEVNHLHVLISVQNAPAWSLTPSGPDPTITANLVVMLAHRYPALTAVELFPGMNTRAAWGAPANPSAYTALLKTVQSALAANGEDIATITGGLIALPTPIIDGDIQDVAYLQALYDTPDPAALPIIGLRLSVDTRDVMADPGQAHRNVLRHYEEIRQVMLSSNQARSLIWVTALSWPADLSDAGQQAQWIYDAYQLLIAQLYIGAVFITPLNPAGLDASPALVSADGQIHPALHSINQTIIRIGQEEPASDFLSKKVSPALDFKHTQP